MKGYADCVVAMEYDFMRYFLGVDEAGRGPLAGPVTAACVCFPHDYANNQITDSKKLSPKKREKLFEEICESAIAYSIVSVGPRRIDKLNILQATRLAMLLCVQRVEAGLKKINILSTDLNVLIDGNKKIDTLLCQETIIKGDEKVMVIGAASILAKVTRDRLMCKLDIMYPQYELRIHKGYPTKSHMEKIAL